MRFFRSDAGRVLIALVAALGLGAVVASSGNPRLAAIVRWFEPVGTIWVNAIRMTLIPLVLSLLITGMASLSDLTQVGKLGLRSIAVFGGFLVGSALLSASVAGTLTSLAPWPNAGTIALPAGAEEAAKSLAVGGTPTGLLAWLVTLVPTNPVNAAARGDMVGVIVFGFFFALAIGRAPAQGRESLLAFFKGIGEAMLVLVRWIVALAPIAVFALVLPLASQAGASLAGAVGLYIGIVAATCLAITAACYPVVATLGGRSVGMFFRAALPSQLIGVSCSSSLATLPAMLKAADDLEIEKAKSGFALPLAVSVFKLAAPVAWISGVLFLGRVYGVPLSVREIALVAAASVFISFAAPGVPRGAFLLLTPLITAVGLPAEGVGVLIAVDLIPDMCNTVVNVTGDLAATAVIASEERATT